MQLLRVVEPSTPISKELCNMCFELDQCKVSHLVFYVYAEVCNASSKLNQWNAVVQMHMYEPWLYPIGPHCNLG
jgi:hypothetical protein